MENTKRFSDRVDAYVKYRPGYPSQIIPFFIDHLGLRRNAPIADIGSGTGKLTELFAEQGYEIIGVEPNEEMRLAGEKLLSQYPNFASVDGTAENTTLDRESVDFIVAGQAFHWFEMELARVEFKRILKAKGWVVLIWNEREGETPLLKDYEDFLHQYSNNYSEVNHRNIGLSVFDQFFGAGQYHLQTFPHHQAFDFEGLVGRYQSSSYSFTEGHLSYAEAMEALRKLFDAHALEGQVRFEYITKLYYGRLG